MCPGPLPASSQTDQARKGIVFVVSEFPNDNAEFGTGFFIDHDGLIATAAHVVQRPIPPESTSGCPPQVKPASQIKVYSPALNRFLEAKVVRTGQDRGEEGCLDVAFVRATLGSADREHIRPLTIGRKIASQDDVVHALGPHCAKHEMQECYSLDSLPASIQNNLPETNATVYQITITVPASYSGGPLINREGEVVGIGSLGERLPGSNNLVYKASYTLALYLMGFLSRLPPSSFLRGLEKCSDLSNWEAITFFDVGQLNPKLISSFLSSVACSCVCNLCVKNPELFAALAGGNKSQQFFHCVPSGCKRGLADLAIRNATSELSWKISRPQIKEELRFGHAWLSASLSLFRELEAHETDLDPQARGQLYKSYGDFFYKISEGVIKVPSNSIEHADEEALVAYYKTLQLNPDKPDAWRSVAYLSNRRNDKKGALEAMMAARRHGLPYDAFISDFSYLGAPEHAQPSGEKDPIEALGATVHRLQVEKGEVRKSKWQELLKKFGVDLLATEKDLIMRLRPKTH